MGKSKKRMARVGGVTEVGGSQNSVEIDGLAHFAVDEHNKKQNTLLQFQKVVNSKQQVVSGTVYYITLEATDGGHKKVYEAKIWEKAWSYLNNVNKSYPNQILSLQYLVDSPFLVTVSLLNITKKVFNLLMHKYSK